MRLITDNLVLSSTLTSSTENVNFPLSNLKNILRSKRFRTISNTTQSITIDMGSAKDVDSVILLFAKEGNLTFSGSEVITIQANATDVWTTPSIDQVMTLSQYRQASHYFSTTESYRYWRVTITDPSSSSSYIELGKIVIGKSLDIQCAQNGFIMAYDDNTKRQTNDYGTAYADIFPVIKTMNIDYNVLDYDTITMLENVFLSVGSYIPVFMCLDEMELLFNKDHLSIYGLFSDKFSATHINYNLFNSSGFKITELN